MSDIINFLNFNIYFYDGTNHVGVNMTHSSFKNIFKHFNLYKSIRSY